MSPEDGLTPEGFADWPIALATAEEWAAMYGVRILDADGWRGKNAPALTDAISETEFRERLARSTIQTLRRRRVGFVADSSGAVEALWG